MLAIPLFNSNEWNNAPNLRTNDPDVFYHFIAWMEKSGLPLSNKVPSRYRNYSNYDPQLKVLENVIWEEFRFAQEDLGPINTVDFTIRNTILYVTFNHHPPID